MKPTPKEYILATYEESLAAKKQFVEQNIDKIIKACELISGSMKSGRKLMIVGNGGSAADAQHMAAEMIGRMLIERNPLPAMALTTDTSNITAIANDYSYEAIFEKQVQGFPSPDTGSRTAVSESRRNRGWSPAAACR